MSIVALPILRTEAGVHSNPGTEGQVFTHCNNGTADVLKLYREVFIHWNGAAWVEDPVFDPLALNSQVALRIDNQCTGDFSLVKVNKEDFRAFGQCCSFIPPNPPGLRFNFNDIAVAQGLVANIYNVSDWNTFFSMGSLATTPFAAVHILGNSVVLIGGTGMQIKANSFNGVSGLLSVVDNSNTVAQVEDFALSSPTLTSVTLPVCTLFNNNAFNGATSLTTVTAPILLQASTSTFEGCTSLVTINLPLVETLGNSCFRNCSALKNVIIPAATFINGFAFRNCNALEVLDVRSCVPFGTTSGNDLVFFEVAGITVTITLAASETTDGDIVALSGVATVTLVPV